PLIHLPKVFGIDFSITKHVFMLWVVAAVIFIGVTAVVRAYVRKGALVPSGGANLLEVAVDFVRETVALPNLGEKWLASWLPLLLTLFLFILGATLIGIFPIFDLLALLDRAFIHSGPESFLNRLIHGGATATANYNVTAGLATVTFIAIIVAGTRAHGFVKHW